MVKRLICKDNSKSITLDELIEFLTNARKELSSDIPISISTEDNRYPLIDVILDEESLTFYNYI